jgi:hypothetical protein
MGRVKSRDRPLTINKLSYLPSLKKAAQWAAVKVVHANASLAD